MTPNNPTPELRTNQRIPFVVAIELHDFRPGVTEGLDVLFQLGDPVVVRSAGRCPRSLVPRGVLRIALLEPELLESGAHFLERLRTDRTGANRTLVLGVGGVEGAWRRECWRSLLEEPVGGGCWRRLSRGNNELTMMSNVVPSARVPP